MKVKHLLFNVLNVCVFASGALTAYFGLQEKEDHGGVTGSAMFMFVSAALAFLSSAFGIWMSRQSKSTYKTHLNSFAAEMFNEEALRAGDDSTKVSDGAASGGSLRAGESIDVSRPPVVSNPEEEDNGTWWGEAMRKSGRAVNAVNFLTGSARTKVEPTLIPLWKHSPDSTEENPVGNPDDDGAGVDLDDMLTDEDEAGAGVDLDDMMSDSDEDEAGVLSPKGPQVAGYQRDLQNSVKAKGIFGFLGKLGKSAEETREEQRKRQQREKEQKRQDDVAAAKLAFAKKHGISVDEITDEDWADYLKNIKLRKVTTRAGTVAETEETEWQKEVRRSRAKSAARADKIKELEEEDSPRQPEAAKTVLSDEPDWKREMREKKEKARARKKTAESGGDVTGDGKTAPEAAPPDKVARGTDEYPDDGPGMRLKEPDWKREMREKKEARRREKEAAGSAQ